MQVSAQYQLTQSEVRSAYWRIAPFRQTWPYLPALALPVGDIAIGFQVLGRFRADDGFATSLVFGVIIGVVILLRQLSDYARVAVPSAVTVTEDRVMRALPTSMADVEWHRFVKTESVPDLWLLYIAKQSALIIPKRAFTPEQQQEIEALVQR